MNTLIVAKTIIFNEDGKLLRMRRSKDDDHRPGGTDIPGGKVDDGEEIVEGAVREIQEEVGLTIDPAAMHLSFCYSQIAYNTDAKGDVNVVWLGFITTLPQDQEVRLSHEHQAFEWLSVDNALEGNDSTSLKKFIGHLKEHGVAQGLWDVAPKVN
jgi:8-oxo-dGTP pyrophosphatase MutT (NUDIX family)